LIALSAFTKVLPPPVRHAQCPPQPMTFATVVQGKVSLGRLQRFFDLDELDGQGRTWTNRYYCCIRLAA
jgi:hypothetical protein